MQQNLKSYRPHVFRDTLGDYWTFTLHGADIIQTRNHPGDKAPELVAVQHIVSAMLVTERPSFFTPEAWAFRQGLLNNCLSIESQLAGLDDVGGGE